MLKWVSVLVLLCALAAAFYWGQYASSGEVNYITAPVERGQLRETVTATGTIAALVTIDVSSQVSGRIVNLFVDFNDIVKKGQPLAQIDQQSFLARLAEAEAALKIAETSVDVEKAKLDRAHIDLLDAEARRAIFAARADGARARLKAAESDLKRKELLKKRGTVSTSELEQAQAQRDSAEAAVREAEALVTAHEQTVAAAGADLAGAEAQLARAKANIPQRKALLQLAHVELDRTTIRSPIDGLVIGRNIDEGQTVAAALEAPTLFTIAGDLRDMEIHVRVDETDIGRIAVRQKAGFTVDAFPGQRFFGVVSEIRKAAQVVQNVVTYTVVIRTTNPDEILLPGMTALVIITVTLSQPLLKVPTAALRYSPSNVRDNATSETEDALEGQPAQVWRLGADRKPEKITVGTGSSDASSTAVLSGPLTEGDLVITSEIENPGSRGLFGIRLGF